MTRSIDWTQLKLVVFDVDGTLYSQKKLRTLMFFELVKQTLWTLDFSVFPILYQYRRYRETLAEEEVFDFESFLVKETSKVTGYTEMKVIAVINEWIEVRPLKHLKSAKYRGVSELFSALKENGKTVGVLSDYRATEKLKALGLNADLVVSAQDQEVKLLKPNPRGLNLILEQAQCEPHEAILIGDRDSRDGACARRASVQYLIKIKPTKKETESTFAHFDDKMFEAILLRNN